MYFYRMTKSALCVLVAWSCCFVPMYASAADCANIQLISNAFVLASASAQPVQKSKTPAKNKKTTLKRRGSKIEIGIAEAEKLGMYDIVKLYMNDMCIKEIPFFLSLHRCFYRDARIANGDTLFLSRPTIQALKDRAIELHHINELRESSIKNIDSLLLYKEKKNRKKEALCNFTVYVDPGSYEIPKTGASIEVPRKLAGSIYYNSTNGKMVVYMHTMGIKLKLPLYAKALTLGLISDMDVGFAELERGPDNWTAILLYVKGTNDSKKSGWSFNVTECNTVRPHSEE